MANLTLADLNQQIQDMKVILGEQPLVNLINDSKTAYKEFIRLKESIREMNSDLSGISFNLKQTINSMSSQKTILGDIKSSMKGMVSLSDKLMEYRKGETDLSAKEIKNLGIKADRFKKILEDNRTNNMLSIKQQNIIQATLEDLEQFKTEYSRIRELQQEINSNSGVQLFAGVSDLINAIPGLKVLGEPLKEAAEAAKDAARLNALGEEGGSPFLAGLKSLGPSLKDAFGPMMLIGLFVEGLAKADKETTELKRSMVLSTTESMKFRTNMAFAAADSEKLNITTSGLLETFSSINKQFGYINDFTYETLDVVSRLTGVVGIAGESANNLAAASELSGVNFETAYQNSLGLSYEMQRQEGIQIDLREILTNAGKITGQIRANLGANPVALATAVTQAHLFGLSLQEINEAGKTMLDFESSISNELQAELLLGRDINLEKARSAALNGDQIGLAKALNDQIGTYSDFSKMNVLQQQSLAAAAGLTVDKLEQALFTQDLQNKSRRELVALGGEELANRIESQTLADKFSATMDKLKGIVTDLATAFMPILDIFGAILQAIASSKIAIIGLTGLLTGLAVKSMITAVASIFTAGALTGPLAFAAWTAVGLAGLAASVGAGIGMAKSAGDVVSPASGQTQISTKEGGLFNLSRNDDVVAAPGLINKLNSSQSSNIQNIVYDNKEARETNMLLRQMLSKQGTVQIDNTKIGTAFAMNTYEIQ